MYPLRIRSARSIIRKLLVEIVIALVILLVVPMVALAVLKFASGSIEIETSWPEVVLPEVME